MAAVKNKAVRPGLGLGIGMKRRGSRPKPTGPVPALDFSKPENSQYLGQIV